MDRKLTFAPSRDHGEGNERSSRQPFPPRPTTLASHTSTNFLSPAKISRTPYPRHLSSASTPDLRERAFGPLDEEQIPPVPPLPSRIPPPMLPNSPSFSNLSHRRKAPTTVASPSTPNLQHHQHQPKFPATKPKAEEKQPPLPPSPPSPPTRPRLAFSPSITNLSGTISRPLPHRPGTAASPSTPNLSTAAANLSSPDVGDGQDKTSKFKKLRSGLKKRLHREPKQEEEKTKPLEISGPTDFRQFELDKDLKPVGVIATEYVEGSLSVPRFGSGG